MRDATLNPGWISYALEQRDGAYAMDTLRDLAHQTDAPDLTEAERSLARREDPLCDLAIATFGRDPASVHTVFRRATNPSLRIAVLANPYYSATGWSGSVLDEGEARTFLGGDSPQELLAFFGNPRLSPDGLLDVFLRRGAAVDLHPKHPSWPFIFSGLATNASVGDLFDTRRVLPSASARYQMNAALRECLEFVHPSPEVSAALGDFLVVLLDDRPPGAGFPTTDLPRLILHWHPTQASEATGHPDFRVQMLLSILYGYRTKEPKSEPFGAVRAAVVAQSTFETEEELNELCNADPSAFFAGMPYHKDIYDDPLLATCFVSLAAEKNQSALAIYLGRRAKFDKLWGLDRPATARDLEKLRLALAARDRASVSDSDVDNLQRNMVIDASRRSSSGAGQGDTPVPFWRYVFLILGAAILILVVYQLLEASAASHVNVH